MRFLNHHSRRYVSALCAIALMATSLAQAFAQQPATSKRPITHKDYDAWHSIQSPYDSLPNSGELIAAQARLTRPAITADTRFVVFSIEPTKADLNKAKRAS